MKHSEQIDALAAALAKVQGKLRPAAKGKVNPFYKSHYADLPAIVESCRSALSENGIAVVQATDFDGEKNWLETMLIHSSGQWMHSRYPVKPVKDDPQGLGSAQTYARRYSLMAMVGVVADDEDDDANLASGKGNGAQHAAPPSRQAEPRGAASEPPDSAVVAFLKGKNLTLPIPGARAGKPDLKAWAVSMGKAIDACPEIRVLDDLWGMNSGNLADLQKVDVAARVALEQKADEKRASLTQPTFLAAE